MNRPGFARGIVARVAKSHGVKVHHIYGTRRWPGIVAARWEAIYEVMFVTGWSETETGMFFGLDHSSVHYAVKTFEKRYPEVVDRIVGEVRAA